MPKAYMTKFDAKIFRKKGTVDARLYSNPPADSKYVIPVVIGTEGSDKPQKLRDDDELVKFMDGAIGVVEMTREEEMAIWERYTKEYKYTWVSNNSGYGKNVGFLADMPVFISLSTAVVKGYKLVFWHPTSQVVDYRMIEDWFTLNAPEASREKDGRYNRTDATNFHNIFPYEPQNG